MPPSRDPLGKQALFWAGGGGPEPRVEDLDPEATGKRALFSPAPAPAPGPLVLECSSCGASTGLSYADFVRRNLPVSIWLPWRKFSRLLVCPACSHRTWVSVSWHPQG
jgi:hypothetical protein